MKSDIGVFSTYYLGLILGTFGVIFGAVLLFAGLRWAGTIIILVSLFLGKFLVFKARRRKGHIIYDGGRI